MGVSSTLVSDISLLAKLEELQLFMYSFRTWNRKQMRGFFASATGKSAREAPN